MKKILLLWLLIGLTSWKLSSQDWKLFLENQPAYFLFENKYSSYDNYGTGPYYIDSTRTVENGQQHYILAHYIEDHYTGECLDYVKDVTRFYNSEELFWYGPSEAPLVSINEEWYYEDILVFKPLAHVGDQWQYNQNYYSEWDYLTFTCDSIGLTSFVGLTDSVKYFSVQAFKDDLPTEHVVNESVYILSKNYGFIAFSSFSQLNQGQHFQAHLIGLEIDSTLYGTDQAIDFSLFFPYKVGDHLVWRGEHELNQGDYTIHQDYITSVSLENYSYTYYRITEEHSAYDGSVTITEGSGTKTFDVNKLNEYLKTSYWKAGFDIIPSNQHHEVRVNKNIDSSLISFSYGDEYLDDMWGYCEPSPYYDPKTYNFDTEQGYLGYSGIAEYGWVKLELLSYTPASLGLQNDTVSGSINQAIVIDVLANDSITTGGIISFTQGVNGGQVTLGADNTFTYVSESFYCGVDMFTYTIADDEGNQHTAIVFVHLDCSLPQENTIIAEVICESIPGFITVLFFVVDINFYNQYRVCGDSTWIPVLVDDDGFAFPIFYSGVINPGSETDYCMEFSHSSEPENIITLQEDHIACCCSIPDGSVEARILLEGAYNASTNLMKTTLQEEGLLPAQQPFNVAPYDYEGTEYINEGILSNDFVIVDWVLVEIRTGEPSLIEKNTEVIARQAGLLLNDGLILGTDFAPLHFDNLEMGASYHICIRHRNHLDVISSQAAIYDGGLFYDFTTDVSQAFGLSQQVEMSNGKAAMFTGDYTQDGVIQNTDYDAWINNPAQIGVYSPLDGTLDGVVQQTDSDAWLPNRAKIGIVEIQY